ncbi:NUDIX domain-containing protein [Micromonospora sp. NBC_01813]|uniref:NUDIX domain-containing protein n=1 Tax=Micromonospora sp. NBC_01813 TaxID=2975988 RepID=UPI003FA36634
MAAYGVCPDPAGRLLMVRASALTGVPGWWQIPGGGVEQGEHPADAVVREFAEETGLAVEVADLVAVDSDVGPDPITGRWRHTDRIVYQVVARYGVLRAEAAGGTDLARFLDEPQLSVATVLPWCARLLGLPERELPATTAPAAAGTGQPAPPQPLPPGGETHSAAGPPRGQRFGAYGVVTDPAGRLLLTRIAPGYPGAGRWHLPGGGTDFGERPTDGLLRELVEETGQRGRVDALLGVRHHHDPAALGPEGHPVDWHVVQVVYRVLVDHPAPPVVIEAAGGSTEAVGWFTAAEVGALPLTGLVADVLAGGADSGVAGASGS